MSEEQAETEALAKDIYLVMAEVWLKTDSRIVGVVDQHDAWHNLATNSFVIADHFIKVRNKLRSQTNA